MTGEVRVGLAGDDGGSQQVRLDRVLEVFLRGLDEWPDAEDAAVTMTASIRDIFCAASVKASPTWNAERTSVPVEVRLNSMTFAPCARASSTMLAPIP